MACDLKRGRTRIALDDGWLFVKGKPSRRWLRGEDDKGQEVSLPHCWNATDTFMADARSYRGYGAYRRVLTASELAMSGDCKWFLVAGGFYGTGDVWWDGCRIASVDGMYLGFCLDLTERMCGGESHVLAARITNDCRRSVLPGIKDPDFILHGGLAGGMWLESLPKFRLVDSALRIAVSDELTSCPRVCARVVVSNDSASSLPGRLVVEARDGAGGVVAQAQSGALEVASNGTREEYVGVVLESARPWSPDHPFLYTLSVMLVDEAGIWDRVERRIGIRRAEFRPREGFFLNNKRIALRGCNRHEAMPGFGNAIPSSLHREDAEAIKKMGLNFVRLSHYPQSEAFLDACDELGLLVYAEIASWKTARGGRWLRNAVTQLERMIARDSHRPSIIVWGIGNEARAKRPYLVLKEAARNMDPSRPVAYAENHLYRARRSGTVGIPDVWGVNYELEAAAEGAEAAALKCAIVTECSNAPDSSRDNAAELIRQVEIIEEDLRKVEHLNAVAGFALWCFADYATERKSRGRRFSGVVDAWRLWKPAAYYLAARYALRPVVFLFANWAENNPRRKRTVHVFTNCDEVAIVRNGIEVATLEGSPHISVEIDFEPGMLVAKGARGGEYCEAVLESFGEAQRLSLEAEECLIAGGHPVGLRIKALDAKGRVARDWSGQVVMECEGSSRAVPNFDGGIVSVMAGEGRAFILPCRNAGTAVVMIRDRNMTLKPASLELAVRHQVAVS